MVARSFGVLILEGDLLVFLGAFGVCCLQATEVVPLALFQLDVQGAGGRFFPAIADSFHLTKMFFLTLVRLDINVKSFLLKITSTARKTNDK